MVVNWCITYAKLTCVCITDVGGRSPQKRQNKLDALILLDIFDHIRLFLFACLSILSVSQKYSLEYSVLSVNACEFLRYIYLSVRNLSVFMAIHGSFLFLFSSLTAGFCFVPIFPYNSRLLVYVFKFLLV